MGCSFLFVFVLFFCIPCSPFIQGRVTFLWFFFLFYIWHLAVHGLYYTHTSVNNIYREPFPFSCWLHSEKPTMVKCLTLSSPGDRVLPLHGLSSPCVPTIRRCPRLLPTTTSTSLHIAWDLLADLNATNTKLHDYHVHPVWHEICKAVVRLRFRACITCGQPHWTWTLKALRLSATWGWLSPGNFKCLRPATQNHPSKPASWTSCWALHTHPFPILHVWRPCLEKQSCQLQKGEPKEQQEAKRECLQQLRVRASGCTSPSAMPLCVHTCTIFGHCSWSWFPQ